ncbi:hypothetical protein Tco_1530380 [Tanacetum coccineum]
MFVVDDVDTVLVFTAYMVLRIDMEKPDTVIMKASTPTNIRQLVIENESRSILDSSNLRPLENILPREHSRQEIAKPIIFPTLTRTPSTSTAITLTTQIPERFEWIRVSSTSEEWERLLDYKEFLYTPIVDHPYPDEDDRFLDWVLSTSREVPDEFKRLKWTHCTATTYDTSPDDWRIDSSNN